MRIQDLSTDYENLFSEDYETARDRFEVLARQLKATTFSYPVCPRENLTMDVAVIGQPNKPAVAISSGVHGVEGFFGSAIQLALMSQLLKDPTAQVACPCQFVLIHAVNPYGFQNLRRCNENNVDLNRNFLAEPQTYKGAPDGYRKLDSFLNPKSSPRFDGFLLRALWKIFRNGIGPLTESIAKGQYDFPNGLFFGGSKPSKSYEVLRKEMKKWFGEVDRIVLVDFHTGLGKRSACEVFPCGTDDVNWYARHFDCKVGASPYDAEGDFATWFNGQELARSVRSMVAEFGTYHVVSVLSALRNENRLHHHSQDGAFNDAVKRELLECFCPKSIQWRRSTVKQGLGIISQAVEAIGCEE